MEKRSERERRRIYVREKSEYNRDQGEKIETENLQDYTMST